MAMKLVKKTDDYTIYQRGDNRYAVQDANKNTLNGEDKVRILLEEGLIKAAAPAAPVVEVVEEEAPAAEEAPAEEVPAEEVVAEEAPAEEPAAEEAPAEEASEKEEK